MRLSSMADYAVVTMAAAARHYGAGMNVAAYDPDLYDPKQSPLSAARLAEETGLPTPTVQKLVSRLSAAGLLRSVRGAGGGLRLARPAAAISLAQIIEAVEGPITLTPCIDHCPQDWVPAVRKKPAAYGTGHCMLAQCCTVRPHWRAVNAALRDVLADVPLTRLTMKPEGMP